MKQPRNCGVIITAMIDKIPKEETEFLKDLQWNKDDASYKAPEETIQWERTMATLQKHIVKPKENWHWEVLEIFTTRTIDQLKAMHI